MNDIFFNYTYIHFFVLIYNLSFFLLDFLFFRHKYSETRIFFLVFFFSISNFSIVFLLMVSQNLGFLPTLFLIPILGYAIFIAGIFYVSAKSYNKIK